MMAVIYFLIMIPLLVLAAFLSKGKGASFIAGYNTLSEEEKAQYDEAALCRFAAKIIYGVCFSFFLWGLSEVVRIHALFFIGLVLMVGLIMFALAYVNTGNRFKRN